jgi:hypothetical protein
VKSRQTLCAALVAAAAIGNSTAIADTLTFEAGREFEIDLGPLASRTQGKPISPSSSGPPYRVTGTDSNTNTLYEYFTDNPYFNTGRPAWQNEGTVYLAGGGSYSVATNQTYTDFAGVERTGIVRMQQGSNCGPHPNTHPVTGNPSYCAVFGPEIWTAPFSATAGQALSVDYAASDNSDDYEVYGYLVAVDCSDPQDLNTCDYGGGQGENATDPTTTHTVFLYGRGDRLNWSPASGEVPADGVYRFRFTNGSYDGTGGKALGNFFYVDPNSLVVATAQKITFAQPDDRIRDPDDTDQTPFYGDFTVEPTVLSGATIVLTSDTPANCTVSDANADGVWDVDIDDAGNGQDVCTLVATAAAGTYGGVDYAAATPVSRSFLVLDTPIAPSNTSAPAIITGGTVESRTTITFDEGAWTNGGATVTATTYQWVEVDLGDSSETDIPGATGEFYCIDDALVGSGLKVIVTKTNAVGATSSESSPTSAVVQGSGACDVESPSVTLTPTLLANNTIRVDVLFSEPVTRLEVSDFELDGPAAPISFTGSGSTYSVIFPADSGITNVRLPAAVAIDASGNDNTASNTVTIGDLDQDGIPDTVEGTVDTDGDGIPDSQDTDSDGDGIPDSEETAGDTDNDGTPNYLDDDSDGDGVSDADEGSGDLDGDGTPDSQDDDVDGDGIADASDDFPFADTSVSALSGSNTVRLLSRPASQSSSCSIDEDAFDPDASFPDTTEYVPYGRAVSFRFAGCAIGETITVSVDFGETLPAGSQIHKVDEATWSAPLVDVTLEGRVFSYTLTDGGDRDADGVANGVIVDPVTASLPRGNGGPTAIPTVPAMLLWLMSVLVAFAGAVRLRR